MRRVVRALAAVGFLGGASPARAETAAPPAPPASATPSRAYTLADCLAAGLSNATAVANARRDLAIARARIEEERGRVLPQFTARAEYQRVDEVTTFETPEGSFPLGRLDNYSASAEASQLLYSGGSVSSSLRAARRYRERNELELRRQSALLARNIRTGFYNVLLARERRAVAAASLKQLEEFAAEAEQKVRFETASEFDLLSARVRAANQRPALIRAERDLRVARAAFRNLVHLPEDFSCDGRLTFTPLEAKREDLTARALQRRPELRQQERIVGLAEADLRIERADYLPTVRLRAAYRGTNPESFGSAEGQWSWHWDAGVTAEWSIFNGGITRQRVRQKRLVVDKARADLEELRRTVALEVERAWLDLGQAAETVTAGQANVGLAKRNLEIARTRYRSGLSTYLEFTDTNLALREAQLAYWQAVHDHLVARARLRYAAALPDPVLDTEVPAHD